MSLYRRTGGFTRSRGLVSAIWKELRALDLRPVSRINFKFDPFHPSSADIRNLMFYFSQARIRDTNSKCIIKTEVVSDNSQPQVVVKLENKKELDYRTENLTALEFLQHFNKTVLPLIPKSEEESKPLRKGDKKK